MMKLHAMDAKSLRRMCMEVIGDNLCRLCRVNKEPSDEETDDIKTLCFQDENLCLPVPIPDDLLQCLCVNNHISDVTLSLFTDSTITPLNHVDICHAKLTSSDALSFLNKHKISSLNVSMIKVISVHDIMCNLNSWTLRNLKSLNVEGIKEIGASNLTNLSSLQILNVSKASFSNKDLEILAETFSNLISLDISQTLVTDISCLLHCQHLRVLRLYNLHLDVENHTASTISHLTELREIDISTSIITNMHTYDIDRGFTRKLLSTTQLKELCFIDVSGQNGINKQMMSSFLQQHPMLKFCGLLHTGISYDLTHESVVGSRLNTITIASDVDIQQTMVSIQQYINRPVYIKHLLRSLFTLTRSCDQYHCQLIELVVGTMKRYLVYDDIQLAGTACLHNLIPQRYRNKDIHIHPTLLTNAISTTLDSMEKFSSNGQLQRNCLLILHNDQILYKVMFDWFRAARLAMDCVCMFTDETIQRMALAICGILAVKVTTDETTKLGQNRYMQKLLQIVRQKLHTQTTDELLKYTLSTLWNLTDESPSNCATFLSEGGLDTFKELLTTFTDQPELQNKVLGLLNNLAEVESLKPSLLSMDFLSLIRQLLDSDNISVSYFCAGILSHLLCQHQPCVSLDDRNLLLEALYQRISSWPDKPAVMVTYRSFYPILPLLSVTVHDAIRLWAIWAISHACTRKATYLYLLIDNGGLDLVKRLALSESSMIHSLLAKKVLELHTHTQG